MTSLRPPASPHSGLAGAVFWPGPGPTRPAVQEGSWALPLAALALTAVLWLPSELPSGDFSASFLIPFVIFAWLMFRSVTAPQVRRAAVLRAGLWIEIGCAVLILLFAMLSSIDSPAPARSFRVILPMMFGLGAMLLLPLLPSQGCRRLVYACLLSGTVLTAVGLLIMQQPGVRPIVMDEYRFAGFFDNANQKSLVLSIFLPLALALGLTTARPLLKLGSLAAFLVLAAALVLTGGKTALGIGFVVCAATAVYYVSRDDRSLRILARLAVTIALVLVALPILLWILSKASPITFEKVTTIFTGGVQDYASIRSRNRLWEESLRLGFANPLTGAGAGTMVFHVSHSHNVVLDYFRGLGLVGALSIAVIYVMVAVRTVRFYAATFASGATNKWQDSIIAALYLGALAYLSGNMLSDSLSPSTSFFFWLVYVAAYISERSRPAPALAHRRR